MKNFGNSYEWTAAYLGPESRPTQIANDASDWLFTRRRQPQRKCLKFLKVFIFLHPRNQFNFNMKGICADPKPFAKLCWDREKLQTHFRERKINFFYAFRIKDNSVYMPRRIYAKLFPNICRCSLRLEFMEKLFASAFVGAADDVFLPFFFVYRFLQVKICNYNKTLIMRSRELFTVIFI